MRIRRSLAVAVLVPAVVVVLAGPASAGPPRPGGRCTKAGAVTHVAATDVDLRCVRKGSKLVWVKVRGSSGGGQASGSGAAAGSSTSGIASSAQIPKVLQNWALALAPFDAATGRAGVMQISGVEPPTFSNPEDTAMYSHIVGLYGESIKGGIQEPQMGFYAPLGTPVIAMSDGVVCSRPKLYSGDYSVRVAPTGFDCRDGAASVLVEHEHLLNPTVQEGDRVRAGQQLGTVSDYNPHWKAKGLGVIETGIFFIRAPTQADPGMRAWRTTSIQRSPQPCSRRSPRLKRRGTPPAAIPLSTRPDRRIRLAASRRTTSRTIRRAKGSNPALDRIGA
jgi:hypothetical protein